MKLQSHLLGYLHEASPYLHSPKQALSKTSPVSSYKRLQHGCFFLHGQKIQLQEFHNFTKKMFRSMWRHGEDESRQATQFELRQIMKACNNRFDSSNFIDRGGFGCVYLGSFNGQKVAVKVSRNMAEQQRTQFDAEVRYLSGLQHQNIIRLAGYCEAPDSFYLVYPYMKNGNVKNKLQELDWSKTLKIIKGTARAIEELHRNSLIYLDLKPENILLDKDFTPKLTDFGTVTPEGEYLQCFSEGYTDPVISDGAAGTKPNDIYSLGVVILQLIMKEEKVTVRGSVKSYHIGGWARSSYYSKIRHAVDHKLIKTGCSGQAASAITLLGLDCVSDNTRERPTIAQVLRRLGDLEGK